MGGFNPASVADAMGRRLRELGLSAESGLESAGNAIDSVTSAPERAGAAIGNYIADPGDQGAAATLQAFGSGLSGSSPGSSPAPNPTPSIAPTQADSGLPAPPFTPDITYRAQMPMVPGAGSVMRDPNVPVPAGQSIEKPPSIRAVRLPNGRTVFTNRPEYSGAEVPLADAGRGIRREDEMTAERLAQESGGPTGPGVTPTRIMMSDLLRRSVENERQRAPVGPPSPAPSMPAASVGDMGGHMGMSVMGPPVDYPQQSTLDRLQGMAAAAGLTHDIRAANQLPGPVPGSPAANPTLQIMDRMQRDVQPRVELLQRQAAEAKASIPKNDPDLAKKQKKIDADLAAAVSQLMGGLTPPRTTEKIGE